MTPDMSYEREGARQSNAQKTRVDGKRKKRKHELMHFLHFLVRVCIDRLGSVPANILEYQYQVPGGENNVHVDKKKTYNSITYGSTADIIESSG